MREIKFRAYFPTEKRITPTATLHELINKSVKHKKVLQDELIILRYSGLNDSNGNEIYEGYELLYLGTNMSSMVVKFIDGCFVGEGPFNTLPLKDYINADDFQSIEITGTIYETITFTP